MILSINSTYQEYIDDYKQYTTDFEADESKLQTQVPRIDFSTSET